MGGGKAEQGPGEGGSIFLSLCVSVALESVARVGPAGGAYPDLLPGSRDNDFSRTL